MSDELTWAKVRANEAGRASVHVLGRYIRGTVVIAVSAAVCDLVVMLVMRVPLTFPLAALMFLGAFIPIVGALVTELAAALVALVAAEPADGAPAMPSRGLVASSGCRATSAPPRRPPPTAPVG